MRRTILAIVVFGCIAVFAVVYQRERTVERGRQAFARYGCASCHYSGGAPNLQNVGKKYDRKLLEQFLKDPDAVYRARQYRPLNQGYQPMPRLKMSPEDVSALVAYLHALSD